MINCPYCGKLTDPQLDSCVHCGGFLKKQSGARPARRSSQSSQTCTNCGALIQEGDIICVACGTNLLTGQKIAEERKQQAAKAAPVAAESNTRYYIIGGVLAALIAIIAIIVVSMIMRDPVTRAKRLASSNRMLDAITLLETHTAKHTDDAAAFFEMGKLHWLQNNMPSAAQSFEKAARLNPSNSEATRLAVLCYSQSQTPGALDAQVALLERAAAENPSDGDIQYLLGLTRGAKQDFAGQAQALDAARGLKSGDAAAERASGVAHALQNDFSAAEERLGVADPTSPDSLAAAGIVASMKGDNATASKKLEDAVKGNTSIENEAMTRLGLLLIEEGKYAEAAAQLNNAVTKNPGNNTARYFLAICLDRQRLTSQALSEFEALSDKPGPFQARAAIQAARLNIVQQNPDRAIQILGRVQNVTVPSEVAELETVRGRANSLISDFDAAKAAFRKAAQADSSYAPAHLEMGLVLIQGQDIPEGIRELERYLRLIDETDPDAGAPQVKALVEQLRRSVDTGRTAEGPDVVSETNERGVS
jgi:tetratricopeptide (TPR) repeat protein